MSLGLDLSQSRAKVARAREHSEALEAEAHRVTTERNPYSAWVGEIDPDTGWCSVFLKHNEFPPEYRLGIIVGDLMHNLRSALDYIVAALVEKSPGVDLTRQQFPIFLDKTEYEKQVGTRTAAHLNKGPLLGVTVGLEQIWNLQPFHRKIDPRGDPLAFIHRYSNADKHRIIASEVSLLEDSLMEVLPAEGIVERIKNAPPPFLEPNQQYAVGSVRYAAPFPSQPYLQGYATVEVHFTTPAFGQEPRGLIMPLGYFDAARKYVGDVVHDFEAL